MTETRGNASHFTQLYFEKSVWLVSLLRFLRRGLLQSKKGPTSRGQTRLVGLRVWDEVKYQSHLALRR